MKKVINWENPGFDLACEKISSLKGINCSEIKKSMNISDGITEEELLELENKIGYVKKGVSIEQKLSLKIEQYSPNKIDCKECVICKELFKENEFIRILDCSHIFHIYCIDEWFKDNKICPICKKEVE